MELAHSDEHNEDNPPPDVWRPKVCPLVVLVLQLCGSRSSGFPDETFVSDSPIKEEDEGNGRSSTSGRSSSLESLKAADGTGQPLVCRQLLVVLASVGQTFLPRPTDDIAK